MTGHLTSFFPAGRDRGVTVAVEGFFAFVWFGWGQADPPPWLVVPLAVGDGLAVLLTVAGVVLTTRSAGPLRVMADPAVRRRYSIIVGLEFGLLGAGAAVLGATGQARWIPAWICAGVGVHFFPLASTLANRSLRLLGVLLIAVATAALGTGLASATAPSTVTGAGAGLCLLAFGLATLLAAWRRPAVKIEVAPSLPRSVRWLTVASISTGRASMSELWRKGAVELAAMIRDREASSREVVQAHLDRIEAVNPHLNAIVRLLPDQALAAADAADLAVADGARLGPLHGVPFTVKENIDVAGTPTTHAIPALAEAVASVDAPQVERLRTAGAIPLGRTNLPDFGLRVHTDSFLHGLTRNPWNPERTAGGSSGGEAAALATGMSPFGLGNDLGGSLRNPAHCCGVASIKPSTGAVAAATVIPPEDYNISFQLMAVEGVLARRIADVRAAFTVIAGQHPRDPLSVPAVFTDLDPKTPGERPAVAVLPEPPGGSTHPEVAAAVRRAADALADDGFKVTEAVPPDYEQALELWSTILIADLRVMKPVLDELMGPGGRQFLDYALGYLPESDVAAWAMAHTARHGLARRWSLWYQEYPVLLSPVWTQPAFPLDFDIASLDNAIATLELMRPVLPANLLGTPAAVVPAGMAEGLPVGVQVMGGKYTELRCLAVAEAIEQRLGTLTPIDPVAG